MRLSSFQLHLIMALLSTLLYVLFRGVGVVATIATAFFLHTRIVEQKEKNWKKLSPFFHALWLIQVLVISILYILSPHDLIAAASRWVDQLAYISSPLDRVAEAAILFPESTPLAYKSVLKSEFFRSFYPAAQISTIVSAPFFGLALASMLQLAETANPSATRQQRIFAGVACSGFFFLILALFFTFDFGVLPGFQRGLGPVRPIVLILLLWIIPFFTAFGVLLWKQGKIDGGTG